jgi:hypothetical protein
MSTATGTDTDEPQVDQTGDPVEYPSTKYSLAHTSLRYEDYLYNLMIESGPEQGVAGKLVVRLSSTRNVDGYIEPRYRLVVLDPTTLDYVRQDPVALPQLIRVAQLEDFWSLTIEIDLPEGWGQIQFFDQTEYSVTDATGTTKKYNLWEVYFGPVENANPTDYTYTTLTTTQDGAQGDAGVVWSKVAN